MTVAVRVWAEIFVLSWRRTPALTCAALAAMVGNVVAIAGAALALRTVVNATTKELLPMALVGAATAAVAYALLVVVRDVTDALVLTVADRVGRMDLHPRIHLDLATLDGLEHLEQTDYLDRITLVRKAGGRLAAGMWNTLKSIVSAINLAVSLLLLGTVNPLLLLLLPFAAVPIWFDYRGQRAVADADLATAESYRLQQHLFDLMVDPSAGKEIRVSSAGRLLSGRQSDAWRAAMSVRLRAHIRASAWTLLGWIVFVLAFVGGVVLAAAQAIAGRGTPGDLVLLVTIAATLRASVQSVVESTAVAAAARQYLAPFLWLRAYAARSRSASTGTASPPDRLRTGITLDRVGYRYPGTNAVAVDGVSIHLPAGSVVAVVGEYGSGKTTLVKLLCKFYRPAEGRILVDGADLADLRTATWRSRCTAAFQDFGRFHTTVGENVGLGDMPYLADERRINDALRDADAVELVHHLPDGLDTRLGPQLGGIDLSEGQWQRTALARASMRTHPLLMILDEPTASLDAPSEQAIFARYMRRARDFAARTGAVTVIVSHRFSTVTGADLILVMDHGRLIESGGHAELRARGGTYAELYDIQADAYRMPAAPEERT